MPGLPVGDLRADERRARVLDGLPYQRGDEAIRPVAQLRNAHGGGSRHRRHSIPGDSAAATGPTHEPTASSLGERPTTTARPAAAVLSWIRCTAGGATRISPRCAAARLSATATCPRRISRSRRRSGGGPLSPGRATEPATGSCAILSRRHRRRPRKHSPAASITSVPIPGRGAHPIRDFQRSEDAHQQGRVRDRPWLQDR